MAPGGTEKMVRRFEKPPIKGGEVFAGVERSQKGAIEATSGVVEKAARKLQNTKMSMREIQTASGYQEQDQPSNIVDFISEQVSGTKESGAPT